MKEEEKEKLLMWKKEEKFSRGKIGRNTIGGKLRHNLVISKGEIWKKVHQFLGYK